MMTDVEAIWYLTGLILVMVFLVMLIGIAVDRFKKKKDGK